MSQRHCVRNVFSGLLVGGLCRKCVCICAKLVLNFLPEIYQSILLVQTYVMPCLIVQLAISPYHAVNRKLILHPLLGHLSHLCPQFPIL